MGGGSTLDAAQQCGRKAIGIDADPHWWTVAQRRVAQLSFFDGLAV
jgi:DNA modification methylase